MAFVNIFSDHLPLYVDLEFHAGAAAKAPPVAAKAKAAPTPRPSAPAPARATAKPSVKLACANCKAGKRCRWRGKEGHLPEVVDLS